MTKTFNCTNILVDNIPMDDVQATFSAIGQNPAPNVIETALENYIRAIRGAEDAVDVQFDWQETKYNSNAMVRPITWFLPEGLREPRQEYPFSQARQG